MAVPQLRILHLLQAFIYLTVALLAPRRNSYALGAGVTIALAWNGLETFGPHLMQAGAILLWSFFRTGQIQHIETMMVPIGGLGHFVLMIACMTLFVRKVEDRRKWWKFLAGGVLVLGYFVLIIAIAGHH